MIELFNRLQRKFGTRCELVELGSRSVRVRFAGWGEFVLVFEQWSGRYQAHQRVSPTEHATTANSEWLLAVALGKTRDDAGNMH